MESNDHIRYRLSISEIKSIFQNLASLHYQNIGPVARDGAIMLEYLTSFDDLAIGYHDQQGKGNYVLKKNQDESLFQYAVGPQSFKKFLHPPKRKLWSVQNIKGNFDLPDEPPSMAFWSVRGCDLAAIEKSQ